MKGKGSNNPNGKGCLFQEKVRIKLLIPDNPGRGLVNHSYFFLCPGRVRRSKMSPMPMQSKIGDASLKFGPDWLRALSSSENPGPGGGSNPGGDGGHGLVGPPPRGFGFSGWGNSTDGRSAGFHSSSSSNNKDHHNQHHNYSAAAAFSSPPSSSSFHPQHSSSGGGGFGSKTTPPPPGGLGIGLSVAGGGGTRFFKQSDVRYSREEMLALYDKNLEAPAFLLTFGTLFMEKMQPPLAFSQPSEEEIVST